MAERKGQLTEVARQKGSRWRKGSLQRAGALLRRRKGDGLEKDWMGGGESRRRGEGEKEEEEEEGGGQGGKRAGESGGEGS